MIDPTPPTPDPREPAPGSRPKLAPPPLTGTTLALRPLDPGDYGTLRAMELTGEAAHSYRHLSATPSPEQFARSMWDHVLVNFAVVTRDRGQLAGNAVCYQPDHRNGNAWISLYIHPPHRGPGAADIVETFIGYLFTSFGFRKLYADVLAPNLDQFAGAVGRYFDIEARHRDDTLILGHYVDRYVLALWADRWAQLTSGDAPQRPGARFARLLTQPPTSTDVAEQAP